MILHHVKSRLMNTPLLITSEYGSVITSALADRLEVEPMVASDVVNSYVRPNRMDVFSPRSGIMTVPIVGGLVHRGDGPDALSGVQSYTSLHNKFEKLLADNTTRGILIDADTGGGEAAGLVELAAWLPKAAAQANKPVWWVANTVTGSAAYWLATSADRIYAAHNSRVGSIGVYVQHVDVSKAVEKRGMVVSFIYAGDHKVDGNPYGPLPDDVRASIQSGVDKLYGDFVGAVASNRKLDEKVVRDTQARVYGPEDAYELGLVDGVGGLGSVLSAFAEHLNRPFVGYTSHGDTMAKELIFDQADLDRAVANGKAESVAALADANVKLTAAAADRTALLASFAEIAGDNPKVAIFVEALNEGGSVALAGKMAAKIEAPQAAAPVVPAKSSTAAAVDAMVAAAAPNVSDAGGAEVVDDKAKRMAEITASMKSFNQARGR